MQRAVEDETVAPLLYEERVPELTINEEAVNRWFDKITAGLSDAQRADPPPVGSVVTYRYSDRTPKGLPRFASFLRVQPQ